MISPNSFLSLPPPQCAHFIPHSFTTSNTITVASPQYRQDLPPAGGFEAVKYKRNLPIKGPHAWMILGAITVTSAYGFYRLGLGNIERRELRREKMWARIHLAPLLMAEGDRAAYAASQRNAAVEAAVMKDVKDWKPDEIYHNPRHRWLY